MCQLKIVPERQKGTLIASKYLGCIFNVELMECFLCIKSYRRCSWWWRKIGREKGELSELCICCPFSCPGPEEGCKNVQNIIWILTELRASKQNLTEANSPEFSLKGKQWHMCQCQWSTLSQLSYTAATMNNPDLQVSTKINICTIYVKCK
jgi:hypothetical protein